MNKQYHYSNFVDFEYDKYRFTQKWFHDNIAIKTELHKHIDPTSKLNILEIGNFEGLSSCFFSDNYLQHSESKLHCVDPFYLTGTVEGITCKCITEDTEKMFLENISKSKMSDKVETYKMTSDYFFEKNDMKFDIIYIDGCHERDYIQRDINNAFKCCNKGGIIWFDDYGGHCKKNFDEFLQPYDFDILYSSYQLGIKFK